MHHIFPKNYLIKNGFKKSDYNQVANYTFTEQQINIKLGNLAPKEYMVKVVDEIKAKEIAIKDNKSYESEYSSIKSQDALIDNKALNCIPESLDTSDYTHYNDFLSQRRQLMAQKIKAFYLGL